MQSRNPEIRARGLLASCYKRPVPQVVVKNEIFLVQHLEMAKVTVPHPPGGGLQGGGGGGNVA